MQQNFWSVGNTEKTIIALSGAQRNKCVKYIDVVLQLYSTTTLERYDVLDPPAELFLKP